MKKLLFALAFILTPSLPAHAQYFAANGWCEDGNKTVTTVGIASTSVVQLSYPSCTVTVYDTGTTNLVSLFSTSSGTAKANPFTAATTGRWFFYAAPGTYDIKFSAGGIPTPFTIGGVTLYGSASTTQTISNKTIDNTNIITVKDTNLTIQDNGDVTKQLRIDAASIGAGTTRTWTAPNSNTAIPIIPQIITITGPSAPHSYAIANSDVTIADTSTMQTFTNKTLTSPALTTPTITNPTVTTGTFTSPALTTPTLTNPTSTTGTFTSPSITTDIRATTAGSPTLGTNALPFESLYLGTAATNNLRIDPAVMAGAVTAAVDDPVVTSVKLGILARGTATFTAAMINANACGTDVTAAVTGLAGTAALVVSLNAAPDSNTDDGLIWYAWPTANTVHIRVCNPTAGAITPSGNLVFNYAAILP